MFEWESAKQSFFWLGWIDFDSNLDSALQMRLETKQQR
ncbi:MAG: hypothetical protein ACI845_003327 [Gammaproteobacteria bacterium]